jgi:hypothetical protein
MIWWLSLFAKLLRQGFSLFTPIFPPQLTQHECTTRFHRIVITDVSVIMIRLILTLFVICRNVHPVLNLNMER